jgi:hypothetical protein
MELEVKNKASIIEKIRFFSKSINDCVDTLEKNELEFQITGKWSILDNLEHLTSSNFILSESMNLPKIIVKNIGGVPNESRSAEEIINIYSKKLLTGSKSNFAFNPKIPFKNKKMTLRLWNNSINRLISVIDKWEESDLDKYAMPHPIIGKVSIREMLFFTVYHIYHHGNTIQTLAIYSKV